MLHLQKPPKENEASSLSVSISHCPSQSHMSYPFVFFVLFLCVCFGFLVVVVVVVVVLFLGSTVRFIISSFYPLSIRHRAQQGDINSREISGKATSGLWIKYTQGLKKKTRLTLVKHPHKRGATNRLITPGLPDLPST